jgi:hypothetical protein
VNRRKRRIMPTPAPPLHIPQLQSPDYYSFQYWVFVIYTLIILVIVLWKIQDSRHCKKIGTIMILLIAATLFGTALNQFTSPERFEKFIKDVGVGLQEDIRDYQGANVTLEIIEAKPPEPIAVYVIQEMGGGKNNGGIIDEYQSLRYIMEMYLYENQSNSVKIYLYDYVYYFVREYKGLNELYVFDFRAEIYLYIITNTIILTLGITLALYIVWKTLLFQAK